MIDDERQDQAALYVMRMLPSEEALKFSREMESDDALRTLVRELEESAAALAHSAPLRMPPPELRAQILDTFRREQRIVPMPLTRWVPWALAACAVGAACALFLENQNLRDKLAIEASARQQRSEVQSQMVNLRSRDLLDTAQVVSLGAKSDAYASAKAVVVFDAEEQRGVLKLDQVPQAAAGKDYQLWVIEPGGAAPVSAGVVRVAGGGVTTIAFRPDRPVSRADAFAVSVEQSGGSAAPQGEIVLLGK
jgi:anti-sigma-K factor RskA